MSELTEPIKSFSDQGAHPERALASEGSHEILRFAQDELSEKHKKNNPTPQFTLYYKPTCPYCIKVLHFLEQNDISVPLKNINENVNCNKRVEVYYYKKLTKTIKIYFIIKFFYNTFLNLISLRIKVT